MARKKFGCQHFSIVFCMSLTALFVNACASTTQALKIPNVQVLFTSQYCEGLRLSPGLKWLSSEDEWPSYNTKLNADPRVKFINHDVSPEQATLQGVLIISLGQKTSGGYGLKLASTPVSIQVKDESSSMVRSLFIPVNLREPSSGTSQISVVTNPCIGLSIFSEESLTSKIDYIEMLGLPIENFEPVRIN